MSKNNFFAAIFALRIYRFAQVPNARFGHVQMNLGHAKTSFVATLGFRICRLSSKILYLPAYVYGYNSSNRRNHFPRKQGRCAYHAHEVAGILQKQQTGRQHCQ